MGDMDLLLNLIKKEEYVEVLEYGRECASKRKKALEDVEQSPDNVRETKANIKIEITTGETDSSNDVNSGYAGKNINLIPLDDPKTPSTSIHKKLKYGTMVQANGTEQNRVRGVPDVAWKPPPLFGKPSVGILTDPISGLRVSVPIVSETFLKEGLVDRKVIRLCDLKSWNEDRSVDWVTAGVIVGRSQSKVTKTCQNYVMWTMSDLGAKPGTVTVFLFNTAFIAHGKNEIGTVVCLLNPKISQKREGSKENVGLTVDSGGSVLIIGKSKDYGLCKSKKSNGLPCTQFVNTNICEHCIYHAQKAYRLCSSKRAELQSATGSRERLRNKVLGKNEVFYGGQSYTAIPAIASKKQTLNDRKRIELLSGTASEDKKMQSLSSTAGQCIYPNLSKLLTGTTGLDKDTKERQLLSGTAGQDNPKRMRLSSGTAIQDKDAKRMQLLSGTAGQEKDAKRMQLLSGTASQERSYAAQRRTVPVPNKFQQRLDAAHTRDQMRFAKLKSLETKEQQSDINDEGEILQERQSKLSVAATSDDGETKICEYSHRNATPSTSSDQNRSFPSLEAPRASRLSTFYTQLEDSITAKQSPTVALPPVSEAVRHKFELNKFKSINFTNKPSSTSLHQLEQERLKKKLAILLEEKRKKLDESAAAARVEAIKKRVEFNLDSTKKTRSQSPEVLSPGAEQLKSKFSQVLATNSRHMDLIEAASAEARDDYFNRLEQKEKLEEKMLSTYKVDCTAVKCLKCKYTSFSSSEFCKKEAHPIRVVAAVKRFFKCHDCSNRTVSLDVIPLVSCRNCGGSHWERAPMMREKKMENPTVSIFGNNEKRYDFNADANLNLLVPE